MSNFVPKEHLRLALLFLFNQKKKTVESNRLLVETYGEHAPSIRTCETWFRQFKSSDFIVKDNERSGRPQNLKNEQLQEFLDDDPTQTQEQLAKALNVSQETISRRLRTMEKKNINKQWLSPGEASSSTPRPNRSSKMNLLSVRGDQSGIVYYEHLKFGETVNAQRYGQQMINLNHALIEKRPKWDRSNGQGILLHDNAPSHTAKPVKDTLKSLRWDIFPHLLYCSNLAPSDYPLFASMKPALVE
ncbi:mariner Mos1 transposase [Trichonephila clavipes]|nr:mariner Mos1 transposase [Trichonephila clavipes]